MSCTVVVPTIGRPSLRRTLGALLAALEGGPGPAPHEIIVVDDRPAPGAPLPLPDGGPPLRVLRSGGRGPAAARNTGWRAAATEWVAFLDDDVVPGPGWPERLAADLAGLPAGVAGSQGRVTVPLPDGRRPTDAERGTAGLARAEWITADMAYRRGVLAALGGFDERFRRAYREDADLALRVLRAGGTLVRGSREVTHPVRPSGWWASVRAQAGNADDVLMWRAHGPGWRARAGEGPGLLRRHVLTTASGAAALAALPTTLHHHRTARTTRAAQARRAVGAGPATQAWRTIRDMQILRDTRFRQKTQPRRSSRAWRDMWTKPAWQAMRVRKGATLAPPSAGRSPRAFWTTRGLRSRCYAPARTWTRDSRFWRVMRAAQAVRDLRAPWAPQDSPHMRTPGVPARQDGRGARGVGRWRLSTVVVVVGGGVWGVLTARFAAARIRPGPRTPREVATMLVTSAVIPPAAVRHRLCGLRAHRRAGPWAGPRVVLFDRDDTLIRDVPYNGDPALVEPMPGARLALERLRRHGVRIGVVTNQSGVARGLLTAGDVRRVNARVEQLLGRIDVWEFCPHDGGDGCACRKPRPGMIERAARRLGARPSDCAVIGDIGHDVEAAAAAGARGILVPTGRTRPVEIARAVETAPTLAAAVDLVLGGRRPR